MFSCPPVIRTGLRMHRVQTVRSDENQPQRKCASADDYSGRLAAPRRGRLLNGKTGISQLVDGIGWVS